GKPSGRPDPIFLNCALIGRSVQMSVTSLHGSRCAACHIPERSGLPSPVRGAVADRLGLPSARRGTPAVGYVTHCAPATGDGERTNAAIRARTVASRMLLL